MPKGKASGARDKDLPKRSGRSVDESCQSDTRPSPLPRRKCQLPKSPRECSSRQEPAFSIVGRPMSTNSSKCQVGGKGDRTQISVLSILTAR